MPQQGRGSRKKAKWRRNLKRCQVTWNPGRWPYVQRCDNRAKWVGTHKIERTIGFKACEVHSDVLDIERPVMPV